MAYLAPPPSAKSRERGESARVLSSRAQAALEMIISIGFLISILAIVALMALEKSTESSEIKTVLDVKRIGESMKDNIDMISQQGPGYYKYFSVSERISGDYDYNVTISNNLLEITWADKVWSTQLSTPDVRIYSFDKGRTKLNRVMNNNGVIEITGHRSNLRPDCNSLRVVSDGSLMNVTFNVENEAHVDDSNATTTAFIQLPGGVLKTVATPGIPAFGTAQVSVNDTDYGSSQMTFTIIADYYNAVSEGMETDNECNITIVR